MRRLFPIVVVTVLAAACGSDAETIGDDPDGGEATIEVADQSANDHGRADVTEATETQVDLGDVFFEPTVLVGDAGQSLMVSLENTGGVDHTFTVEEESVDVILRPGASATAEVTFPESGALVFVCRFHAEAGMRGGLSVDGDLSPAGDADNEEGGRPAEPGPYG